MTEEINGQSQEKYKNIGIRTEKSLQNSLQRKGIIDGSTVISPEPWRYTLKEAAIRLGTSVRTLRRRIDEGLIEYIKDGRIYILHKHLVSYANRFESQRKGV